MAEPLVRGWCPSALQPMAAGDGLVVRVQPPIGRLTAPQARGLATLAARYGNGWLDLTSRAQIQVRGVAESGHPPLIDGLAALGLVDLDARSDAHAPIVTTPFWVEGDGTSGIAAALQRAFAADAAPRLPHKFGFAVDCGATPVLAAVAADIRVERDIDGDLVCRADGSTCGARVTAATVAATAVDLARWFVESGGIGADGRGRMAAHLARGARLPAAFTALALPPSLAIRQPTPGRSDLGLLVGIEFGQLHAETLAALATHGALRLTPWRILLIEGASAAPDIGGLISSADDPKLRVVACTGAPGCPQATQPTRPLARRLARHVPPGALLHVSGCAKGCAHPAAAAVTLCATTLGFDVIRHGRARDLPQQRQVSIADLAADPAQLWEIR